MTVPLVVLIGAGASRGAGQDMLVPAPPLTTELFNPAYDAVLRQYDLAMKAGRHISEEIADASSPPVFENLLCGLRDSRHAHHRHMALAVPFYLQELLWQQSEAQNLRASAYERLTRKLLELESVFFVTLNYDILLDRQLNAYRSLNTLDAYIAPRSNWALLKPHGSINWSWRLAAPTYPYTPGADLAYSPTDLTVVSPDAPWWTVRGLQAHETGESVQRTTSVDRYPALALPLGPDDEIIMPTEHIDRLVSSIRTAAEIDLLVIGYSGYDKAILRLLYDAISDRNTRVRRSTIINVDQAAAVAVYDRFHAAGLGAVWQDLRPEPFADWATSRLDYLVHHYGEGPGYSGIGVGA